jgi:hypothetical protein
MHVLKKHDLNCTYDIASQVAQHVRMYGPARSFKRLPSGHLSLPDQDIDIESPHSFYIAVAHFHRIEARILAGLGAVIAPSDPVWQTRFQQFASRAAALWKNMETKYQHQIAEEQAAGNLA